MFCVASHIGHRWRRVQAIFAATRANARDEILADILVCGESSANRLCQFVASTGAAGAKIPP